MSKFYAKPDPAPIGVTPPKDDDRKPIHKLVGGDSLIIETVITLADGVTPVAPENSQLTFALADQKFSRDPIWLGYWYDGITPVGGATLGRIQIKVPNDITARMRRGEFVYSLLVANKLGNERYTALSGVVLVEYEATSPTHNIPYKAES